MTTMIAMGAVAVAAIVAIPLFLPNHATAERSAVIAAEPGELFPLIASNSGYQRFNPYKAKDPDLKIEMFGPASGIGSGFAFDGRDGKGTQTVVAHEENRSVTMQIDLGARGKPVTVFTLEPVGAGARVTWSTRSDFGLNPVGRVIGLFLDGMLGPDYEKGLKLLGNAAQAA